MVGFIQNHRDIIEKIIGLSRLLNSKGFLAAADGNISYCLEDGSILMTPTGKSKLLIEADDFALMDKAGRVLHGNPSSERHMHLEIYRNNASSRCVFHAHPPTAVAYTIAHPEAVELPLESMPEVILGVGRVPIVSYERPGSESLAKSIAKHSKVSKALIMARHGVVSHGESMMEAYHGVERVEHCAEVLMRANAFGAVSSLSEKQLSELFELRKSIGTKSL